MWTKRPKPGDVMRMNCFAENDVIAHYVLADPAKGPFVVVYRGPLASGEVESLAGYERLFGPVLCGVNPPVRSGVWSIVGRIAPDGQPLPRFLLPSGGRPPSEKPAWWLIDGMEEIPLGEDVPRALWDLETLAVVSADLIEERVQTGVDAFGYRAYMLNFR